MDVLRSNPRSMGVIKQYTGNQKMVFHHFNYNEHATFRLYQKIFQNSAHFHVNSILSGPNMTSICKVYQEIYRQCYPFTPFLRSAFISSSSSVWLNVIHHDFNLFLFPNAPLSSSYSSPLMQTMFGMKKYQILKQHMLAWVRKGNNIRHKILYQQNTHSTLRRMYKPNRK